MAGRLVGVDIGGTKVLMVSVDQAGRVEKERRVPTPSTADEIFEAVRAWMDELGGAATCGIGVPGLVSSDGVIVSAPNLPALLGVTRSDFERALRCPVALENDANCAALSEWQIGAGRGALNLVLIALGTGIGAGLVVGDGLYRGANGGAGEVGHLIVDPDGPVCGCGANGCWEAVAAGPALAALAAADGFPSGEVAVREARTGDPVAIKVLDRYSDVLALGLVSIVAMLDVDTIVVAGGLSLAADVLFPRVARACETRWNHGSRRWTCRIVPGELAEMAGAVGAALAGHELRPRG